MIQHRIVRRVIGAMLMVFSVSLLPPLVVSLLYVDGKWPAFLFQALITAFIGFLLFRNTPAHSEPKTRDGIVIVVLIWTLYSLVGAMPFYWILEVSYTDAVFEAVSGLTTTGSSVLSGLDQMAKSVLWYRQQLGFMGGMGVLILAVAILPMFNIGGMKLYKAEATGPMKDDKLAPRIAQTARLLFSVYLLLVLACAGGYWLAGMTGFDAITHSFATIATGGFGNYDAGMGYFNSFGVELVAMIGMLAGAVNFGLLFVVWNNKDPRLFLRDQECKTFVGLLVFSILLITLTLWVKGRYPMLPEALRVAAFQVISSLTTTGFGTADTSTWPSFTGHFIFLLAFIGGCSGSTSGGMKTLRFFLLFKQVSREAKQLVQPNIVAHVKFNGRIVPESVTNGIWGFFALFVSTALLFQFLLMACDLDFTTAFAVVAASLNNQGLGTNNPAMGFAAMNDMAKWVTSACMLAGRLEIFTFFVLFTPIFWRRF
ncbi:potassium transporter [Permianibacter sp. IMCC34836]|uniref:TrkH family potassium uptake protein n=1 Tax=Permianibacter fluminis TaxID=2738515 RepID=UPI00155488AF|nr:potassium transporter TrkG [Permianibacter fluminis]NQD38971.1 potassium transporter [Permianibacter fluminis]